MTYKTIMVYLQAGADNMGVLNIAVALAERFDAHVVGISACQPHNPMYEEGFGAVDVVTEDRAELKNELEATAEQFDAALEGRSAEWRSRITYEPLSDYVAEQARAADLLIVGKPTGGTFFDRTRCINVGDLVMQAGRPVLLVPRGIKSLPLRRVMLGWKDTREARRAIGDAQPLLQVAGEVDILQVCEAGQSKLAQLQLEDIAGWLGRHDVESVPVVVEAKGSEIGAFRRELDRHPCELLIAGAYGHNRLSEWVFGGVTQDYLLDPDRCVLLSH